jgi:hypothetical protein
LGTPVAVTVGATTAQVSTYTLVEHGSISGTVTGNRWRTGPGPAIISYDSSGTSTGSVYTKADGTYKIYGLAAGSYFVRADNARGYVGQLYSGLSCLSICDFHSRHSGSGVAWCDDAQYQFSLPRNTAAYRGESPTRWDALQGVQVAIFSASGAQANGATHEFQRSILDNRSGAGYVLRANDDWSIPIFRLSEPVYTMGGSCAFSWQRNVGTPIFSFRWRTHSEHQLRTSRRMAAFPERFTLSGVPLSGATVQVYNSAGVSVRSASTDNNGFYTVRGLATGSYLAIGNHFSAGAVAQVFNGITCQSCAATSGTPIAVTQGATTPNISFSLSSAPVGVGITGKVTIAGGLLASNLMVRRKVRQFSLQG